ncbi:hypothetical protein AGMMS49593_03040 [Endomicrobiia bacterium]|nr:hypothetical protein AGMMS49593_03040 [Endomicrobiia bacterium]
MLCIPKKNSEDSCKAFTCKRNKLQTKKFAAVPFNKRVVFVPHCMRNIAVCTAVEKNSCYICVECGGCKISEISKLVKELNYQALYVVKGGRAIQHIIKEQATKAIVGIACFFEGAQAFKILEKENVVVQFVALTKDGCVATDTDLIETARILKYNTVESVQSAH